MENPRARATHLAKRRLRPVPLLLPLLAVALVASLAASGAGAALPPPASEAGHDHAQSTHGPDGLALDRRGRTPGDAHFAVDDHAEYLPCDYDGLAPPVDSRDLTVEPQVHAVYVHPANTTSRFPAYAAMFQADARQASALLQTLGRDIRWDLRQAEPSAECEGGDLQATMLDITVFKSRYSAGKLSGGNQFSLVANELAAKFSDPNKKYVVWLDAGSKYCGQGTLYQDTRRLAGNFNNANRTTGIVYRPYSTANSEGGFCRGRTLLHELGHNLGALQRVAPNAYDGAHCNDDDNDTMCYTSAATFDSGGAAQFDYGKDDYWDPGASIPTTANNGSPDAPAEKVGAIAGLKPAWWALNLSKYICPPGPVGAGPKCAEANLNPGF